MSHLLQNLPCLVKLIFIIFLPPEAGTVLHFIFYIFALDDVWEIFELLHVAPGIK